MQSSYHLVIASGGTGGHFFPTLAIAREARAHGVRVTLLVAGHHCEEQIALARERELSAEAVPAFRLPRGAVSTMLFPFRLLRSLLAAWFRLRRLRPDVVLGMGSFVAVPVCLAAALRRTPLVLHEGNARVGKANRFLSRWARVLATSLPVVPGQDIRCPQARTGMPLRESLLRAAERKVLPEGYFSELGLMPGRPVLLVFGGSQGAQSINGVMREALSLLGEHARRFQVIHLTGAEEEVNASLVQAYREAGTRAWVRRAEPHIENCYLAADLVFCRAGASTISELAVFGKSAILVPYPAAAEDHQTANAQTVTNRDAARLLPDNAATPDTVASLLRDWLDKPRDWHAYGHRIQELACPAAARAAIDLIAQTVGKTGRG